MKRYHNRKRSDRAGFTLMELLLVMAIMVMLAGMGIGAYMTFLKNAQVDVAATKISSLEALCKQYKFNVGFYPNSLNDLYQQPSNMTKQKWRGPYTEEPVPTDPWGNNFNYSRDEQNDRIYIRSNGPDGQQGTDDDIPEPRSSNG